MITFKEHKAFFFTNETITRNEALVMYYLYSYMSYKRTIAYPGMNKIALHCKLRFDESCNIIHSLETKGFIKIKKYKSSINKSQEYTLSIP